MTPVPLPYDLVSVAKLHHRQPRRLRRLNSLHQHRVQGCRLDYVPREAGDLYRHPYYIRNLLILTEVAVIFEMISVGLARIAARPNHGNNRLDRRIDHYERI